MSLINSLKAVCQAALIEAFPEIALELPKNIIEITVATQKQYGHYQCNSAMKLSKLLKKPPREVALSLKERILAICNTHQIQFEKIEIAGPGFINFSLSKQYLNKLINKQLHDPRHGIPYPAKKKKVIIDFSAPNIAKEMHVGHLRSTIIGDSLARILEFLGHETLRLNHIGDWGTQFGMLICYLKQLFPDLLTQGESLKNFQVSLAELAKYYRESKQKFDSDPEFKKQSQQEVVKLQNGEQLSLSIWQKLCEISKVAYQEIYTLLDIKITDRGESFYNNMLQDTINLLDKKNLIEISGGAKCVYNPGFLNRNGEPLPLIVQKTDGAYNYATTDLAALNYRVNVEEGNWLIYVTDAGQSTHFQMVFATAKNADFYNPTHTLITHIPFGLVLRDDGKKFKTRSGETERLIDLLQTAITKATQVLKNRNPEITEIDLQEQAKSLGINAIKYADLSCNRISDYKFSYEKMLNFEGNTAAFLLYAYVRIQSIKRKVNQDITTLINNHEIQAEDPVEIDLCLHICQFSDAIDATIAELTPHKLTEYLFNLANKFHIFFHNCKVANSLQQDSRLLLCEATARIMQQGFSLLGLTTVERM